MHPRAAGRARLAWPCLRVVGVAAFAVAMVAAVVAQEAGPPAHAAHGATTPGTRQVTLVSALPRVEVARHRGSVIGDGRTIYLANRTTFRPRRAEVTLPPRLRARSWAVVDLGSGRLLGKFNARVWRPQASTMKLLTAVTAASSRLRVPHKVTRFETHQTCTCAGLARGYRYSLKTMMEGMLLPSGNDAAEAVAGSFPRGRAAFYRKMNRTARRLGARDTVARNASGLTAYGSHSSARDLVLLLRAALRHRTVREIMSMRSARIASIHGHHRHRVWRGTDYVNRYPDSLGKSGYTTPAKNTLVVATWVGGHHIAASVMGAPYGFSTSDARRLTMWAASNFDDLRAVGRLPHS